MAPSIGGRFQSFGSSVQREVKIKGLGFKVYKM
jgi:hypothetical protein